MPETWVSSLGWEDLLEMGKATYSSILTWRIPWTVQAMGPKESDKRLSDFHFHFAVQKLLSFFVQFCFYFLCFQVLDPKKYCYYLCYYLCPRCLFYLYFLVGVLWFPVSLTFRSLIQSEFIFVYGVSFIYNVNFILLQIAVRIPQHPLIEEADFSPFLILVSFVLVHGFISGLSFLFR